MAQLTGTTIPVSCNQANPNSFVNTVNNQTPLIPATATVQWPCAMFAGDPTVSANLVTDLGNIVTANMVMRAGSATGTVLFEQVIAASQFNLGLTYDQWTAQSAAHFTFTMGTEDTNWPDGTVWIAIGLTAANGVDIPLTYCSNASIKNYGIFNPGPPTAPNYTSYSRLESDTRYANSAYVQLLALYQAGYFLLAPVGPDFRYSRNAMYAAVL